LSDHLPQDEVVAGSLPADGLALREGQQRLEGADRNGRQAREGERRSGCGLFWLEEKLSMTLPSLVGRSRIEWMLS